MNDKRIYITTTLPYVNANPHIGFAMEIIRADILARHYRTKGYEVFFNFGTDEHGQKIYEKAVLEGKDPQAYCDEYAAKFDALKSVLNVTYDNFIRTTDEHHIKAAQEFWKRSEAAGDIYKKKYQTKYCVGCELEKQDSDLESGKCPLHPKGEIELIDEDNYFFRFSKYEQPLLDLYEKHPDLISPDFRMNEIKAFVGRGLADFSISRLKAKMPWGVPVPGDDTQVMYVWFDALVNYISAIGWPNDMQKFEKWWPVIQVCGKDNLRQQSAIWQAMLMSVGLPSSKKIFINGFIVSGGQKMSKSLGNVIEPLEIAVEYGTDALRFFLAHEVTPFEDSDVTRERIKESYNANLANGIGNLASRVMKMSEEYLQGEAIDVAIGGNDEIDESVEFYQFDKATGRIMEMVREADAVIQKEQPFRLWKTDQERAKEVVRGLVKRLAVIGKLLAPFMPSTSEKILEAIKANKKPENLFARK